MIEEKTTDVIIIGGGAVGLYAATLCGAKKLNTKILESLPVLGGQLQTLYPEKNIYNIPGILAIKAKDLVKNIESRVAALNVPVHLNERVKNVVQNEEGLFEIETSAGKHLTKTVLLAIGNGSFEPNKIGVAKEKMAEQANQLHYLVKDKEHFQEKSISILGGGDSAIDIALMLQDLSKEVHLIHRREEFRADPANLDRLCKEKVTLHTPFEVDVLHFSEDENLHAVTLKEKKTENSKTIYCDEIIVNYGFKSSVGEMKESMLAFNKKNKLPVKQSMQTTHEGIFAIGDICDYEGKINNLPVGFGEAQYAVNNVVAYLKEKDWWHGQKSTSY